MAISKPVTTGQQGYPRGGVRGAPQREIVRAAAASAVECRTAFVGIASPRSVQSKFAEAVHRETMTAPHAL